MRLLKITGYVIAGLVGIVLLALLLTAIFFDANRYKADIERLVEEKTQRRLTLQGDLKLSVFPWIAVQLGPAQLGERAGFGPDGGTQPFVSLQSARLSLKLMPLFRGQIEIGKVQLLAPNIRLITNEQGRHNWDDLAGSTADKPAAETDSSGDVSATIAGIDITEGEITLDDQREKQRTALHKFSLQVRATTGSSIRSGQAFNLESAFDVEQNGKTTAQVQLATKVTADAAQKKHALTDLDMRVNWHVANTKDSVPINLKAETLALDLANQTLQMDALKLSVGTLQITGAVSGTDVVDALKLKGHITLAPVDLRPVFKQWAIKPPVTRDPEVLKNLSFDTDVLASTTSVTLQKATLKLDDTTARGEFSVVDIKAKSLRFNLDVDRIDFDRYLPPTEAKVAQPMEPALEAPTPIPVDMLRALNARGELRVGEAKFSGLKMSHLRIGITARDGDVRIAPSAAELYGGKYQGDVTLNVASDQPRLALAAQVANVDFEPFLKDMLQTTRIAGRGHFNTKVTATGVDTKAMLKALNGSLDFKIMEGAYQGMDLWYEIRRARALWRQQPIAARVGPARTAFTSIQGTGTIRDGVLSNQDLDVAMQYLKVAGKGTVDFVNSTLDYRLNAKVLRLGADQADTGEMRELVDAEIPVKITGALASPAVRPDVEGLVKAQVKQKVEEEKGKLQEKLQDKVQDKLKDLFGR